MWCEQVVGHPGQVAPAWLPGVPLLIPGQDPLEVSLGQELLASGPPQLPRVTCLDGMCLSFFSIRNRFNCYFFKF